MSKIFKWFKSDFKAADDAGSPVGRAVDFDNPIVAYIRPYLENALVSEALDRQPDVRVAYLHYDWRLNEQTRTTGPQTESHDTAD